MKEKKKVIKKPSGTVKVDPDILKEASAYCRGHGIKITFFVTEALIEKLLKSK